MYVIWYIFSLFFLVFWGLEIIAIQIGGGIANLCATRADTCALVYESLIDPKGELALLGVGLTLILGPQLMTYTFSAPFGCASTPLFVSQATKIAMWSLIKFLAGAGAILLAEPFAKLALSRPVQLGEFVTGFSVLCGGFLYGLIFSIVESLLAFFRRSLFKEENRRLLRALVKARQWFRRNRPRKRHTHVLEVHVHLPGLNHTLRTQTRLKIH